MVHLFTKSSNQYTTVSRVRDSTPTYYRDMGCFALLHKATELAATAPTTRLKLGGEQFLPARAGWTESPSSDQAHRTLCPRTTRIENGGARAADASA